MPCGNTRLKAFAVDGQGKGALYIFARAYAAAAHNAFRWVVRKIGVRFVGGIIQMILAFVAIAYVAQTHDTGHILQFAVAVGGAGQAVERVVGNVQFHDVATQIVQLWGFRTNNHSFFDRSGARRRIATAAFNFYQAQATGAKGFQTVGGA